MRGWEKFILCLDMDSFEIEFWMQKQRSDLIGKDIPAVLASDHKIISLNYSAKVLGISRDTRLKEVRQDFPDVEIIYQDLKNGLVDNFSPYKKKDEILDLVEKVNAQNGRQMIIERQDSTDEIFIDLTGAVERHRNTRKIEEAISEMYYRKKDHPNPDYRGNYLRIFDHKSEKIFHPCRQPGSRSPCENCDTKYKLYKAMMIADKIMETIEESTELMVSGGLAYNKFVAKLAVGRNKPEGLCLITPKGFLEIRDTILVKDIPGFKGDTGRNIAEAYENMYSKDDMTLQDVHRLRRRDLEAIFREAGHDDPDRIQDLMEKSAGKDCSPVLPQVFNGKFSLSAGNIDNKSGLYKANSLAKAFCRKLDYLCRRYKMAPSEVVLNFKFKHDDDSIDIGDDNRLEIEWDILTPERLVKFLRKVKSRHDIYWDDLQRIIFTASQFEPEEY